jgi:hypothetical protein
MTKSVPIRVIRHPWFLNCRIWVQRGGGDPNTTCGYKHAPPDGALCNAATPEKGPPGVFGWLRQPTGTGRLLLVSLPRQHCGRGQDGRRVSPAAFRQPG